jgi:hypothetical protein
MVLTRRQAAQQSEPLTSLSETAKAKRSNGHNDDDDDDKMSDKKDGSSREPPTPVWVLAGLAATAVVTVVAIPHPFQPVAEPTIRHVFYYGWLTALSTGLGVAPFVFLSDVAAYWVGISNGEYIYTYICLDGPVVL